MNEFVSKEAATRDKMMQNYQPMPSNSLCVSNFFFAMTHSNLGALLLVLARYYVLSEIVLI